MLSSSRDHDAIATAREITKCVELPRGNTPDVFTALCAAAKKDGVIFGQLILAKTDAIFHGRCVLPVYTQCGEKLVDAFKSNLGFQSTLPECAVSSGLQNSLNPNLIDVSVPLTQSKQDTVREIIKCIAPTLPECAVSSGIENLTNPYLIDFYVGVTTVETSSC